MGGIQPSWVWSEKCDFLPGTKGEMGTRITQNYFQLETVLFPIGNKTMIPGWMIKFGLQQKSFLTD